jgi:hypothetical protein
VLLPLHGHSFIVFFPSTSTLKPYRFVDKIHLEWA